MAKIYTHSFIEKVGYYKTHAHVNIYADVYAHIQAFFIQKIAERELKLLRSIGNYRTDIFVLDNGNLCIKNVRSVDRGRRIRQL